MDLNLKHKNKKARALIIVLFLVFGIYLFSFTNVSIAAASCMCRVKQADGNMSDPISAAKDTGPSEMDCSTTCLSWGGRNNNAEYSWNGGNFKLATAPSSTTGALSSAGASSLKTGNVNTMPTANVAQDDNLFTKAIKFILIGVFNVCGWLFGIAATLFAWMVDPKNISGDTGLLNKQAIKDVWIMVRDLLNLGFILVLLFGAFCTIFQVDKWNLKKVWLNVLIDALLVNFSYPIARFIIDISNVAFYYFVNHLFSATGTVTGNTIFASIGGASNVGQLLVPRNYAQYDIAYLVAVIVITFIMGMTLLIIAALFAVRLVALAMLIMFSPIGFAGYIFPSAGKYADKWWNNLFSYSFFAPIMIFIMAISVRITQAIGQENFQSFVNNAQTNVANGNDPNWIANAAFYVIPIIILWTGIGVAKSFGIELADTVVKNVKGGGKWLANFPLRATGVSGASKLWWDNFKKKGVIAGSEVMENRAAWLAAKTPVPFRPKGALNDLHAKRVKDASDGMDVANMTEADLRNKAAAGNEFQKAAALIELAGRGEANKNDVDYVRGKFGDKSKVFNQLRNKVKVYDPVAAFGTGVDAAGNVTFDSEGSARLEEFINSNQFEQKKLKPNALKNPALMEKILTTGNMSPNDLNELSKKGSAYSTPIGNSLEAVANKTDTAGNYAYSDTTNEKFRNLHLALLQAKGILHSSLDTPAKRQQIFSRLNKDNANALTAAEINRDPQITAELVMNINHGKFKEIISNMRHDDAKQALVHAVFNQPPSPAVNRLATQIANDPYLSSLI